MTEASLNRLAHQIAEEDSRTTLHSGCVQLTLDGQDWLDTKDTASGFDRWVARAVKYLDARKLLIHHPKCKALVRWEGM